MIDTKKLDEILVINRVPLFDYITYDWNDLVIGDKTYSKEYIQTCFLDYWLFYQIGYDDVLEFIWRLKREWLSKINILSQKLKLYPQQLSLNERVVERQYESTGDNKFSDTPQQAMLGVDLDGKYLTNRTYNDNSGNESVVEHTNELSKYNEINKAINDVIYEFIKSFKSLFITDVFIYSTKRI